MRKLIYILLAGAACSVAALSQNFTPQNKLRIAEAVIANYYVDTVNEEKLVEDAIKGMIEELDPHSSYTTPEETRQMNEPLEGNFSGIGISFNINRDTLYVIETVAGGPSERVGVLAGDRMIAVNDTAIAGVKMKNSDIQKRLRGPKGTDVNVRVLRKSTSGNDTIDFRITRDMIPIYSVDAAYMTSPSTGYIKLNKYAAETANEFRKAVKDLRKEGMKNLILDLTDNGGGFLHAANELLGELLEPGSLTVYTQGTNSPRQDLRAKPKDRKPLFEDGRLVLMVNQNSASAAEITAGAVQDWDRGLIVGRRTFGKGLVQRPFPFPDGSMIRLTVAHYYTPTERDIQKPFEKGHARDYAMDIVQRYNHGELMHADSIKYIDSLKVHTIRNRRAVYGGGGIYPDSFVPLDTMPYTKYYRDVQAKGVFNRYAIGYVDKNRDRLRKQWKKDSGFIAGFEVTPEMTSDFIALAEEEGVKFNEDEFKRSESLIKMLIKALIGRDTYTNATFFKIYNTEDPIFKEAMRLIESDSYQKMLTTPDPLF